ncbi:MAG: polysaccharide pyruvyl transferase family protein [Stellaceae bacterium]
MADHVGGLGADSTRANGTQSNSRIPAVIGIEPWSWPGDDNSGNMIHAAAARRIIGNYKEYKPVSAWSDGQIEQLRAEHSHIVYVTANLIRLGVPRGHPSIRELIASHVTLANNIERAALPVVVFGLGSQASLAGPYEFNVAPETIRLLKVLSDHSCRIAVRGAFTAEACLRLGVNNVEVIGCQSIFWHRSPKFSWRLSEPAQSGAGKIACNFTDARSEAGLIRQAMGCGYDVVGQSNGGEEVLRQGQPGMGMTADLKLGWDVELAVEQGLFDRGQYERWVRDHFYQFRRPEAWLDHMQHYRFCYGTRLHGNMTAMIAGTRALWIVHDMRTKEVCDHFRLPWVELGEVRDGIDLEALFERADYAGCKQIYPERYRVLFEYVERAGLPHSLPAPLAAAGAPNREVPPAPSAVASSTAP